MWITLTQDDVETKLTASEFSALTTAQLPEGVTAEGLLAEEMQGVSSMVRGYVAANPANTLGAGDTVPDELKDAALILVRHRIFSRLPGMRRLLDEPRMQEYQDAMTLLRDVAGKRFAVVPPDVAADKQAGGASLVVVKRTDRQSSRQKWGGTF